jgi:Ca2+-binding EF-hand superfamily protein
MWAADTPSTSLFLIHSGAVGLFSRLPTDNDDWKAPLAIYRHGNFFNVQALAYAPCKNCAVTMEDTCLLFWTPGQWRMMAREQPLMVHEIMRAILKQQAYDDIADARVADNLHMDMDNHDWEAFEDAVDHQTQANTMALPSGNVGPLEALGVVSRTNRVSMTLSPGPLFDSRDLNNKEYKEDEQEVGRFGDWGTTVDKRHHATTPELHRGKTCIADGFGGSYLPQELQIRVPGLKAAQALAKFGFYDEETTNTKYTVPPLPKEWVQDLQIAHKTFAEDSGLPWASVSKALMFAGIFEQPTDVCGVAPWLSEEEFVELGKEMLMAKLSQEQIAYIDQLFNAYDFDNSNDLDLWELSNLFVEKIHPHVNREEIESLADAWAHDTSGKLNVEAFTAVMSRFVKKNEAEYRMLSAFREVFSGENCTDLALSVRDVVDRSHRTEYPLSEAEATEMVWAASVTSGKRDELMDPVSVDFHDFISVIFVTLKEHAGELPPPPQCDDLEVWQISPQRTKAPDFALLDDWDVAVSQKSMMNLEPRQSEHGVDDVKFGCRARLHLLLEEPLSSTGAMVMAFAMLVVIMLSVLVLLLEPLISGPDKKEHSETEKQIWKISELIFTVIFGTEIVLRMSVCNALGKQTFLQWLMNPSTIIDIAAVVPYFTDLLLDSAGDSFKVLRVLRLFRIGRVMRISRVAKLASSMQNKKKKSGATSKIFQPVCVVLVVIWGIYLKNNPAMK